MLSSDAIASRLKQVLIPFVNSISFVAFHYLFIIFSSHRVQGVKLPPVAARKLRDEARVSAIDKLSSRRALSDGVSVNLVVEVVDHGAGDGGASHRSNGSNSFAGPVVADVCEERPALGFISPEYAEDFDNSSHDAVAQHVSAFMGVSSQGADGANQDDDGPAAVAVSQAMTAPTLVKLICFFL